MARYSDTAHQKSLGPDKFNSLNFHSIHVSLSTCLAGKRKQLLIIIVVSMWNGLKLVSVLPCKADSNQEKSNA